jgi:hypothetical protein
MNKFDIDAFLIERKHVLLSMNESEIRAFFLKYNGIEISSSKAVFWTSVHKARTGDKTLPMFERAASKEWLLRRGMSAMDDGDVFPPMSGRELVEYLNRLDEFEAMNNDH